MAKETFELIENVINKTADETLQKRDFDFAKFVYEMEQAFSGLGFRDSDDLVKGGMEDILIIDFHEVGDFILTTPSIREIRRNFPFSTITLVTNNRVLPLAENCPYVNEIFVFDDTYVSRDILDYINICADFARKNLWKNRYRLGFYLSTEPNFFHQLLLFMSGAKERVGYVLETKRVYTNDLLPKEKNFSYQLLTRPFVYPPNVVHEVERNLYLLEAYDLQVKTNYLELWYCASDLFQAKKLLEDFGEGRNIIAVGIGSSQGEGKYPVKQYLEAFKKIVKKGASLVILGGDAEKEDAKFLQDNLPAEFVKNLCELDISWSVTAAVVSRTDMYLGNDTGVMHCAAACKLPVIVLSREAKDRDHEFDGVSAYYRFFPWQANAMILRPEHPIDDCVDWSKQMVTSSCNHSNLPHCIAQIKPEEIVATYDKLVDFMKIIKEVKPMPVIRTIDQVPNLYSDQNL